MSQNSAVAVRDYLAVLARERTSLGQVQSFQMHQPAALGLAELRHVVAVQPVSVMPLVSPVLG